MFVGKQVSLAACCSAVCCPCLAESAPCLGSGAVTLEENGVQAWDPWQICKQIAVLQALFYLSLFLALVTFVGALCHSLSTALSDAGQSCGLGSEANSASYTARTCLQPQGQPRVSGSNTAHIVDSFFSVPPPRCAIYTSERGGAGPFVEEFSANYLFSSAVTNTYSFVNTMVCLAYIVTAIVCAVGIRIVVARAKKCWDFGATIYILHLVASSTLVKFPLRWFWWALLLTCAAVTILLGELLCVRYEMADIPINSAPPRDMRLRALTCAFDMLRCLLLRRLHCSSAKRAAWFAASARPAPAAASARGAARRRPQQRDDPDLEAQVPLKPRSTSTPGLAGWQELSSKVSPGA